MKYKKLLIAALLLMPNIVLGAYNIPWTADSTSTPIARPNLVNGAIPSINVGTTTNTGCGRFCVWGRGTGSGLLAGFIDSASSTKFSILDNGNVNSVGTNSWSGTNTFGAGIKFSNLNEWTLDNSGNNLLLTALSAASAFLRLQGQFYIQQEDPNTIAAVIDQDTFGSNVDLFNVIGTGDTLGFAITKDATLIVRAQPVGTLPDEASININPLSATADRSLLNIALNSLPRFNVDVEGDTGIATGTPRSKLTVFGDAFLEGSSRYLNFGTSATGTSGYGIRDNAGTMETKNSGGSWSAIGAGGSGTVNSGTVGQNAYYGSTGTAVSGTSTIFTSTASNVGIGTTSPLAKFSVSGNPGNTTAPLMTLSTSTVAGATTTILSVSAGGIPEWGQLNRFGLSHRFWTPLNKFYYGDVGYGVSSDGDYVGVTSENINIYFRSGSRSIWEASGGVRDFGINFKVTSPHTAAGSKFLYAQNRNSASSGEAAGLFVESTWNTSAGTANDTDILINRTETSLASTGSHSFIRGRVSEVDRFRISNLGSAWFAGTLGVGTSTPIADFQATASTSNATTSIQLGKPNQNKGTCLTLYDTAGTPVYGFFAAGATTPTYTSTKPAGCQN